MYSKLSLELCENGKTGPDNDPESERLELRRLPGADLISCKKFLLSFGVSINDKEIKLKVIIKQLVKTSLILINTY